jgi:NAD(P)-dependent dehydrogenase (short-subunit alcohol dehydrogenase family)
MDKTDKFAMQLLAHPAATIYATVRDPAKATTLAAVAEKSSGRVRVLTADAVDVKSFDLVTEEIKKTYSTLDLVIYNSGVSNGFGNILDAGVQSLKDNFDVNVYGAYHAAVAFTPLLLKSTYPKKSLVYLASTFGSFGLTLQVLAAHEQIQKSAGLGSGFDATAMYNVSKVYCPLLTDKLIAKLHRLL